MNLINAACGRATSSRARPSKMPRSSSPRPAARPTPACICRRSRRGRHRVRPRGRVQDLPQDALSAT
jgi:hypothetical protein